MYFAGKEHLVVSVPSFLFPAVPQKVAFLKSKKSSDCVCIPPFSRFLFFLSREVKFLL